LNNSELRKVVVERKGVSDTELFHHHFAGAVGEAPPLIIELLKHFPRM
jgi:hypothetical protein